MNTAYQSPNHSSRNGLSINMLVLHATVGGLQSSLSWLCNPASHVSCHYLIGKAGQIYQLVPEDRCAWHAGKANHYGITAVNARSIGIELENANTGADPYPQAQYDALLTLTRAILGRHSIPATHIVRHADVALPKGRKTDPAGFQWGAYLTDLGADLQRPPQGRIIEPSGANVRGCAGRPCAIAATLPHNTVVGIVGMVSGEAIGGNDQWYRIASPAGYVWSGLIEPV